MTFGTTFYLSRIIGNTVYSVEHIPLGRLRDIVVDLNAVRPRVIAVKIKVANRFLFLDFEGFSITKENAQYRIHCEKIKEVDVDDHSLFLVKDVLDKQIVDMFGRKVVRVNDLRLAAISNGTYLVAVDVGFEGFLRRLGVAKPLKKLLKPFNVTIASNLLLWDEVETIDFSNRGLKLSRTYQKLSTMHASDLADILEDLDRTTRFEIFSSLDEEKAADVLEELETDARINVLESLATDDAVQMLGKLPADEAASILDELREDKVEEILSAMDMETSTEIRDLMEYPDDSVGSLMTTDFVTLSKQLSVEDGVKIIRQLKPDDENAYYLYVVDDHTKLQGIVSLRDLIVSDPSLDLNEVMDREVLFVYDDEDIDELVSKMSKYNLMSIPVVNRSKELIGVVLLSDVVNVLIKSRRRRN